MRCVVACERSFRLTLTLSIHEPTPRPLPGGEQAFVRVLSVPSCEGLVRGAFMVPMLGQKKD